MTINTATCTTEYRLRQENEDNKSLKNKSIDNIGNANAADTDVLSVTSSNSGNSSTYSFDIETGLRKPRKKSKPSKIPIIRNTCCSRISEEYAEKRVVIPNNIGIDYETFTTVIEKPTVLSFVDDKLWLEFNEAFKNSLCAEKHSKVPKEWLKYFLIVIATLVVIAFILVLKIHPPAWFDSLLLALLIILLVGIMSYHFHQDGLRHEQMKKLAKNWKPKFKEAGCTVNYIIPPPNSPLMMGGCGCSNCQRPHLYFDTLSNNNNYKSQNSIIDNTTKVDEITSTGTTNDDDNNVAVA